MNKRREKLIEARNAKGLSRQALADRLGVHNRTIEGWEYGSRTPMKLVLKALCEELEIDFNDVYNEVYDMEN